MKFITVKVDNTDPRRESDPFVRFAGDGNGCGLDHCNCSPANFLTVSDGETLIMVELTQEEADALKTGRVDKITPS